MAKPRPSGLDVYARPYIPQILKSVNQLAARSVYSELVRWIDYAQYTHSFAGTRFLPADAPQPSTQTDQSDLANRLAQHLEPKRYYSHFSNALVQEVQHLQHECEEHALYKVTLFQAPSDPRPAMFWLHVPGLREMRLRVEIGDSVLLRQIHFGMRGEILEASLLTYRQDQPVLLSPYINLQYHSVIWGIDRLKERLTVRVDGLQPTSMVFNASFTIQGARLGALHKAVADVDHLLATSKATRWMTSMLFPDSSFGVMQTTLNKGTIDWEPHDSELNYEQIRAIDNVLNRAYGTLPYMISGPPGTGKTKTLVELAMQLISATPEAHLLVCAPSDPAADTITLRLRQHMTPKQLLRLNSPSRSFPEVPQSILPFCHVDDDMFSLPPFPQMMAYKIVVTSCRDAEILIRARLRNADLFNLEFGFQSAMHPEKTTPYPSLHWTGLLMDEAAQAIEPEACLGMTVVAPPEECMAPEQAPPIFVMAGDQNQLGPRTASKGTALQTSLFERLLSRSVYSEHPLARSKLSGGVMRPLTQKMLPILRPPFANLIRNYRSHPAILATPSALFYNDTLEPEATKTDSLLSWPGWKGEKWPVLFATNTGLDEIEQDGGGWYNNTEARMACEYAQSFLAAGLVNLLRKTARNKKNKIAMGDVSIGPLEAFQGLESRLVIFCTTRTRDRFLEQDAARGLGVINEPRRYNVAMTRAKEGLVVIGNPAVLAQDPCWTAFLSFCQRNGLWDSGNGSWTAPEGEYGKAGKLEKQLLHAKGAANRQANGLRNGGRALGLPDDDEHVLWQSGVDVESALRKVDDAEAGGYEEAEDAHETDEDED
ncbi:hypothetical protein LTR29_005521 [Friedmanniomyces endolithicus]|nr:hypothetical protein LTR29_005521 [Friedmanniomyces endolithicus]